MVSRKFIEAVKLDERPDYKIANAAGIHPSTLSKLIRGIEKSNRGDARVHAIGCVVGLTGDELWSEDQDAVL